MSATEGTRVVLVKPGDVLMLGNVSGAAPEIVTRLAGALREVGIERVLVFEDDIDMALVSDDADEE